MSDIPSELFPEILRFVLVESLFRFRSVCKTWCRIIDDPDFVKKHIHRGIGQDWFFHRHEKGELFLLPINELICSETKTCKQINAKGLVIPGLRDFNVHVSCCNGFILLSFSNSNLVWRIWNPFTGESVEVKQCNALKDVTYAEGKMPVTGIGYDEANDDYKVVRTYFNYVYIYSVSSQVWRRIEDFPESHICCIVRDNGVFAYGALHWVVHTFRRGFVVALDLTTEKFRTFPLPQQSIRYDSDTKLSALSGCLFLSCSSSGGQFYVWMIKDYGREDTWIQVVSLKEERLSLIKPVAYLINKEKLLLRCYLKSGEQDALNCSKEEYLWYDVGKECSERLGIEVYGKVDAYGDYFASQVFPASLIRLKSGAGSDEGVVASQGTFKRKREAVMVIDRLPLKIMCGFSDDWANDDGMTLALKIMFGDHEDLRFGD